jgi:two-component system sensor histidine kinase KdpD
MDVATSLSSVKPHDVNWTVWAILGLLIVTTLAIVPLTLTIIHGRESDAVVIDLAGRQRMLLERHIKEILLTAQGTAAQYQRTRGVLKERVQTLIEGGRTIADLDHDKMVVIPPAPTDEIRNKLFEEQRLMDALFTKADAFLINSGTGTKRDEARHALLAENAALLRIANEVVTLLTRHSEGNVQALIRWELAIAMLVIAAATLAIRRFIQSDRALKRSQAMTVQALRQRDEVKSALLSSVSHELRTPLTAIKTMLFSLRYDTATLPPAVRQEFLSAIDRELDYLNGLVGNLLDMSRFEAGTLVPRREWYVLEELLEGAIRRVEALLAGRPLQVHLAEGIPPLFVDGMQIQQVLVNILDNAIKFSQPGSPIHLTATLVGEALEVRVSNTGEGIPAHDLERVFDRFYRVESGRSLSVPGTGLGLAICKGIVEAHGGSVRAQSVPGRETTILFRIPLAAPARTCDRMVSQSFSSRKAS